MQKPRTPSKSVTCFIKRPLLAGAVAASAIALTSGAAEAAISLQITGPTIGPATGIPILSFEEALGRSAKYGGPAIQLGKLGCSGITMTKLLDASSMPLATALAMGTVLGKAVISFQDSSSSTAYYVVTLTNAVVDAISQSSGGDRPSESFELVPLAIDMSFQSQDIKGETSNPITSHIDCTGP